MSMKTASELRDLFLDYFTDKKHKLVRSAPLIPAKDPTLLFTNAGMVQFKDVFIGKDKRPYSRATSCQKCLRVSGKHNDLEQVGYDVTHNTFFEMLGNFSFGDYFKEAAIEFAWEFIVQTVNIPAERLWITVLDGDDEARRLWEAIGVSADRVVSLGEKDNFWAMADVGPCGPCSEINFDLGVDVGCGKSTCGPDCDCGRFFEIWNLVFMQFDRGPDGVLTPLPAPSVDTGMGFERLACVCQGKTSIFDTDIFMPIQMALSELSGVAITSEGQDGTAFRAISDHIRSHCFLLADGIMPANDGRGYVLRRLIRRAARFGQSLGLHEPFLYNLAPEVISQMGRAYPELRTQQEMITRVIKSEEERFQDTLNRAMPLVMEHVDEVKQAGGSVLDGDKVFSFYDTFGFPLDLVRDIAKENGLEVDEKGFERAMLGQKEKARAATAGHLEKGTEDSSHCDLCKSCFNGYESLKPSESHVERLIRVAGNVREISESASEGDNVELVLDRTPFYAESGGQVSDTGKIVSENAHVEIESVQKTASGAIIHGGVVKTGILKTGEAVISEVDCDRRCAIERGHTATHLLHFALRSILGEHVKQAGSLVEPDRLRFDFSHFGPVSERELLIIESLVNAKIREDLEVTADEMSFDEALDQGALAFFGDKYGDRVRMVSAGGFSKELCGGTHVARTGQIGILRILSSGSISAGVRRIEALTGERALEDDRQKILELKSVSDLLKTPLGKIVGKVQAMLDEIKALRRDLAEAEERVIGTVVVDFLKRADLVHGAKAIYENVGHERMDYLRRISDELKTCAKTVAVLGASDGKRGLLICAVTDDLTNRLDASHIIKTIAAKVGGSGGGRKNFAQAGCSDPKRLNEALSYAKEVVSDALAASKRTTS
ncbi:alanine--tRNA ligase [bacterium]|nr:alanine--tRNA ligase [bacterium]